MFTDSLKTQHLELLSTLATIRGLLGRPRDESGSNSEMLRKQIVTLSAQVTLHLATEDKFLYPNLMKHPNPSIAETARQFSAEMGGIATAFKAFLAHWPNAASIAGDLGKFVREFDGFAKSLGERIAAEERVLYPLIGRV